jgi:hypothetical protein
MIAVINCSCKWYLFQAKPACGAASPRNKIGPGQVSRGPATQPLISYVQVIPRGDAHLMALDRLTLTLLHPCIVVYLHPPNLRLPKVLLEARVEVAPPLKKHCFADELEPRCKLE